MILYLVEIYCIYKINYCSGKYAYMQVPQELKEVLDNTVVAALSHCSPLVSFRLIYFEMMSSCFMMLFIDLALMGREESNRFKYPS